MLLLYRVATGIAVYRQALLHTISRNLQNPTLADLFGSLRPFIWPTYYEEGPPRHVQLTLLGDKLFASQFGETPATRSILEMMTLGYRPVTMLAILKVLYDSDGRSLHGMEVGRELEKKFQVPEGYFSKSRYYTDRVGKVLGLMVRLGLVDESMVEARGNGRKYSAFKIRDGAKEGVKTRLASIENGEALSLFINGHEDLSRIPDGNEIARTRLCIDCGFKSHSSMADYCERCGSSLNVKCDKCGKMVLASFSFCNCCGARLSV